jgi:gliding motility-associated lipoprotein GldH
MQRTHRFLGLCLGSAIFGLAACGSGATFEATRDLPNYQWAKDSLAVFSFEVPMAEQSYELGYHLRNTASYPKDRIHVKFVLTDSAGKVVATGMKATFLFDATTGEPLGRGLGDLFEHEVPLLTKYRFPHRGRYSLGLQQYTREEMLIGVASVGITLRKSVPSE